MYIAILRLIWPFVLRYGANYVAKFLQARRDHREHPPIDQPRPVECPPCPPCPPATERANEFSTPPSNNNGIWFALSGLLLGSAFGTMVYVLVKNPYPHID